MAVVQKPKYNTGIEAIFSENYSAGERLSIFKTYLKKGGERLNLEDYKFLRNNLIDEYRAVTREALKNNELTRREVEKIGHEFTNYIRYEHQRLKDEWDVIKGRNIIVEEKPDYLVEKTDEIQEEKNNDDYVYHWYKKDKELYELERGLTLGNMSGEKEKALISKIPSRGLSRFKINTLSKLIKRARFKQRLSRKLRNINRQI